MIDGGNGKDLLTAESDRMPVRHEQGHVRAMRVQSKEQYVKLNEARRTRVLLCWDAPGPMFLGFKAKRMLMLGQHERILQARVVDFHPERSGYQRPIGPVPAHRLGEAEWSSNRASTGRLFPSRSARATRERRQAPAVWEEDGPTMTGPTMSRREITGEV